MAAPNITIIITLTVNITKGWKHARQWYAGPAGWKEEGNGRSSAY
jgi:hypothetical protein